MGALYRFNVAEILAKHGFRIFIETGTGGADSLAHAAIHPGFERLLSCEIAPMLAVGAVVRFHDDPRVEIYRMDSRNFIRQIVHADLPPALIFLDAHYPGAGFGLGEYHDAIDAEQKLPLAVELEAIARHRPPHDLIIIDDLRIYETGEYEDGPLPADVPGTPSATGADWMRALFPSHKAVKFTQDQGYLVLLPQTTP